MSLVPFWPNEDFGIDSLPWLSHVAVSTLTPFSVSPPQSFLFLKTFFSYFFFVPQVPLQISAPAHKSQWLHLFLVYLPPSWVTGQTVPFLFQDLACE